MRTPSQILSALALTWLSASAFAAADPGVQTVVTAVPAEVTLSRPAGTGKNAIALDTYAAYQFTIANTATSTLNRVFLKGVATNVGGTDAVVFDSSIPASVCKADTGGANTVSCSLPSLAPGQVSAPVVVVFKAPRTGTQIRFDASSGGFEGNGGGNGCCSQPSSTVTGLVDPTTNPQYLTQTKTFVRPDKGGTVFTGNEAIPTTNDPWASLVVVPSGFGTTSLGDYTVATVVESSDLIETLACPSYSVANAAGRCFASKLNIPGTFASLDITLRLHKDYFKLSKTFTAANVPLYYTPDGGTKILLLQCASTGGPSPHTPCLDGPPTVLRNTDTPIKELWGALQFRVKALDNGRYDQ